MTRGRSAFLLVHGSWMGGWCWDDVANVLRRSGAFVLSPTLSGVGTDPDAGLSVHTAQIVDAARSIGAEHVRLVGHSYGAAVAAEAAALLDPARTRLTMLDGFLLGAGDAIFSAYPAVAKLLEPLVDRQGFILAPPAALLETPGETLSSIVLNRLRPMPLASHCEPANGSAAQLACPVDYVRFTRFPAFAETELAAAANGWTVAHVDAGHMAIATAPEAVAATLLEER